MEERTLYDELRGRLDESIAARRRFVLDTELTQAFLAGNQWVKASESRGVVPVDNATNEVRITDNRMLPAWVRWMFYLFSEKPVITCFEGGRELQDAERARVASALCDYWESNCGWREARRDTMMWVGLCGVGYRAPRWRYLPRTARRRFLREHAAKSGEGRISYLEEREVTEWDGELTWTSYSPLHVHLFPIDAGRWGDVSSILLVDVQTRADIENAIPAAANVDWEDEEAVPPITPDEVNLEALRQMADLAGSASRAPMLNSDAKRYLVMQYMERPTRARPRGRWALVVGRQVVRDATLPLLEYVRRIDPTDVHNLTMGIVPTFACDFPGRVIPPAPFGELRSQQKRWNDILTDEAQNRMAGVRNKLLVEEGSVDKKNWTDEHGQLIEVRPETKFRPQWLQAPPLAGIEQEKSTVRDAMEEATGQLDVLRGSNPTGVRAAFHLEILRQEAMTRVFAAVDMLERSYEIEARLCLAIAQDRYSAERIVQIYGLDYAGDALTLKSAHVNLDIRVKTGSMRPRNHALLEAKLVELQAAGAFAQKPQMFWDMSELGTLNRAVDHDHKQRLWARAENRRMLNGEVCMPFTHEDHYLHIEEHRGFMARPEWYGSEDRVKQIFLAHLEVHAVLEIAQIGPEAAAPTGPVAGIGRDQPLPRFPNLGDETAMKLPAAGVPAGAVGGAGGVAGPAAAAAGLAV